MSQVAVGRGNLAQLGGTGLEEQEFWNLGILESQSVCMGNCYMVYPFSLEKRISQEAESSSKLFTPGFYGAIIVPMSLKLCWFLNLK